MSYFIYTDLISAYDPRWCIRSTLVHTIHIGAYDPRWCIRSTLGHTIHVGAYDPKCCKALFSEREERDSFPSLFTSAAESCTNECTCVRCNYSSKKDALSNVHQAKC